jgi:type I restriction enzyme S subunit
MSFPRYERYKDSGVEWLGEVPEHWLMGTFKRMAWIRNGKDYKDVESIDGEFPVIGSGGQFATASQYLYDGESVLLGRKGTIDKPLYINGRFWTVDTMFYTEIYKRSDAKFLYYCALTIPFKYYSTNTALPSMTQEDLSNNPIAIPPQSEQTQIACFLDRETSRIDTLIAEQKRLIALLKEKRQAVISHAVTKGLDSSVPMKDSGVKWLGEVPEHWETCFLKHRVSTVNGFGFSSSDFCEEGVPFIRAGNIKKKSITQPTIFLPQKIVEQYERVILEGGDIVISMVGSDPKVIESAVGQVGMVPDSLKGAVPNQNIVILRENSKTLLKKYLFYSLLSSSYRNHLDVFSHKLANQSIISSTLLVSAKFTHPDLEEQKKIADYLDQQTSKIQALISEAHGGIELLQERRSALISAAVTGKIDLRNWQLTPVPETQEQL